MEKLLLAMGFKFVRQKGSHRFYRHVDGRYTTLPDRGSEDIGSPLIREILKQIALSNEEYTDLLANI